MEKDVLSILIKDAEPDSGKQSVTPGTYRVVLNGIRVLDPKPDGKQALLLEYKNVDNDEVMAEFFNVDGYTQSIIKWNIGKIKHRLSVFNIEPIFNSFDELEKLINDENNNLVRTVEVSLNKGGFPVYEFES